MKNFDESDSFVIDGSIFLQMEAAGQGTHVAEPQQIDPTGSGIFEMHQLESEICKRIKSMDDYEVHNLVVRRAGKGVCLEGTVWSEKDVANILETISDLISQDKIVNRLNHCGINKTCSDKKKSLTDSSTFDTDSAEWSISDITEQINAELKPVQQAAPVSTGVRIGNQMFRRFFESR